MTMRNAMIAVLTAAVLVAAGCGPKGGETAKEPDKEKVVEPEQVAGETAAEVSEEASDETADEAVEETTEEASEETTEEAPQDTGPEVIELATKAKLGKVTLPHHEHQESFDCKSCHHTYEDGGSTQACHTCHGVEDSAPAAKDAFHQTCQGCHKENGGPAKKCNGCHKK